MKLNQSWKTNTAGIATISAGLGNLIADWVQHGTITTSAAGIAVTAVIAGIGLINAKDNNVSNSPTPLATAQNVGTTLEAVATVVHVHDIAAAATVAETVERAVTKPVPQSFPEAHKF